jgi:hypothetical protein
MRKVEAKRMASRIYRLSRDNALRMECVGLLKDEEEWGVEIKDLRTGANWITWAYLGPRYWERLLRSAE